MTSISHHIAAMKLAAVHFEPDAVMRKSSEEIRLKKSKALAGSIEPMTIFAAQLLVLTKAEMIARIDKRQDCGKGWLDALAVAEKDAKAIAALIASAKLRLSVAMANIQAIHNG
jgi:hypothetical protein